MNASIARQDNILSILTARPALLPTSHHSLRFIFFLLYSQMNETDNEHEWNDKGPACPAQ